jgi:hypothetical protein
MQYAICNMQYACQIYIVHMQYAYHACQMSNTQESLCHLQEVKYAKSKKMQWGWYRHWGRQSGTRSKQTRLPGGCMLPLVEVGQLRPGSLLRVGHNTCRLLAAKTLGWEWLLGPQRSTRGPASASASTATPGTPSNSWERNDSCAPRGAGGQCSKPVFSPLIDG